MRTSLSEDAVRPLHERLRDANGELAAQYPGESPRRQPVHTVYGGAHLFRSDSAGKLGAVALRTLERYAPDADALAAALDLANAGIADTVYRRVVEKLRREPVEDYRIDFEDGYGNRPDDEEDGHAAAAARQVAAGLEAGTLPPFLGIRIKPFSEDLRRRSVRTLDLFLATLLDETGGTLPDGFVVTLPKVTRPEQVGVLAELMALFEPAAGLPSGALQLEIMIETPQAIIDALGRVGVPALVDAADGRCVAAHFGTYDYTAACSITAAYQQMTHPACNFARQVLQASLAGRGIWICDGATNIMPVAPHRGDQPTPEQEAENRVAIHRAWKLHFDDIHHSLVLGYYQGWDLHPAQLPTRFAAVFTFFLEGLAAAGERLRNFVEQAAQATLVGDVFDDAATGQGLLNYFLRALNCGAVTEEEVARMTGLAHDELQSRSFLRILEGRRG